MTDNRYHPDDVVRKEKLELLVAEWLERSNRQETIEEWATLGKCAGELEELIEQDGEVEP